METHSGVFCFRTVRWIELLPTFDPSVVLIQLLYRRVVSARFAWVVCRMGARDTQYHDEEVAGCFVIFSPFTPTSYVSLLLIRVSCSRVCSVSSHHPVFLFVYVCGCPANSRTLSFVFYVYYGDMTISWGGEGSTHFSMCFFCHVSCSYSCARLEIPLANVSRACAISTHFVLRTATLRVYLHWRSMLFSWPHHRA